MTNVNLDLGTLSREERELFELLLKKEGVDPARLPIPRVNRSGPLPLSYTQQRLWLSGQLAPDSPFGNVDMAFRLRGALHTGMLRQALDEVVRRHETLRTSYTTRDGQTLQVINPPSAVPWTDIDLSDCPEQDRISQALKRGTNEIRRP